MPLHDPTIPADSPLAATPGTGPGAAALVAAGFGCTAMGILTILAGRNAHSKALFTIYKPTGPLSGVSTGAIGLWLLLWVILHMVWRGKPVNVTRAGAVAILLLVIGLLLTFPPIMEHL
jgi:hypothetical protein